MSIAGVNKDESATTVIGDSPKVEVRQRIDNRVGTQRPPRVSELENAAFQIVIKILDRSPTEFSAEFPSVLAFQPSEVVENLEGLAGTSARNAETNRPQIFNSGEIEFGQAQLACTEVQ